MFKKPYLISMLLIAMLILAACGNTSNEKDGTNDGNNSDNQEQNEHQVDGTEENDTEDEENNEDEENTEDNEQDANNAEEEDAGQEGNEEDTTDLPEEPKQVDSDAQEFSMSVLPGYTLTSEEPGRDSLYLTEDGSIFMRIETAPFDQETYDFFKENTVDLLQATNANQEAPDEITDANQLPQGEGIENTIGYTTETADGITSGIVFEKNDLLVRLTIFEPIEGNYFDEFLKMGQTITSK